MAYIELLGADGVPRIAQGLAVSAAGLLSCLPILSEVHMRAGQRRCSRGRANRRRRTASARRNPIAPVASCIWAAQPASNAQTALFVIFALDCWGSARSSDHGVSARRSVLHRKATSDRAVATVLMIDAVLLSVAAISGDRRMDVLCVCRLRHGAAAACQRSIGIGGSSGGAPCT